jgi:sugar lactone lactonase YvrE
MLNVTSGYVSVLDDTLGEPNGCAFSPDQSILYASDTSALAANYGLPGANLAATGHRTVYPISIVLTLDIRIRYPWP